MSEGPRARALVGTQRQGYFETLQDALTMATVEVRAHVSRLDKAGDRLAMHVPEWEMLAERLEEASLRAWLTEDYTTVGPDDQIWGAVWEK